MNTRISANRLLAVCADLHAAKKGPMHVDKTPTMKAALWVGGPPGQTLNKLRGRLRKDGIDLREQTETSCKPPSWCELVLVNRDLTSHHTFDQQKKLCKDADIPFIVASLSYSITRRNLAKGALVPLVSITEDESETEPVDDDEQQESPVDSTADLETQKKQLRAFLLSMPPELRRVALHTNQEMLALEEDDVLDKAFVPLQPLLNSITDDGLLRGLKRTLNKETRQRLHTALGLIDS